jgi:hypothetical protein
LRAQALAIAAQRLSQAALLANLPPDRKTLLKTALSHGINTAPVPQLSGSREWSPARWTRRIDVNLSTQWLTAYEDNLVVYRAPIATGRDGFNTPTGSFAIYDKLRLQTMIGADGGESWYVPDVPWVQYVVGGVALHGT